MEECQGKSSARTFMSTDLGTSYDTKPSSGYEIPRPVWAEEKEELARQGLVESSE